MFINFIVFSMIIFIFYRKNVVFRLVYFLGIWKKKWNLVDFFLLYKNCDNKFDYEFVKEMVD